MAKKNFAYETYKNVEAARNYKTQKDRDRYIASMEARTAADEMPFLRKHLPKRFQRVLEIGSGSGRILHALLADGRADEAVGIEISPSRVAFGRQWAHDAGFTVEHQVGDILRMTPKGKFDVVLCVTTILPFFDLLQKNGLDVVFKKAHALLQPGGYLVLETYTFAKVRHLCKMNGGKVRLWEEYRPGDPFRFHLAEYAWDDTRNILTDTSYNLMREELFVDGPTTRMSHFEPATVIVKRLKKAGFKSVQLFGQFDSSPYKEGVSERLVLIARV